MAHAKLGRAIGIAILALLCGHSHAFASTALLWGPSHSEQEVRSVRTYAGVAEAAVSPVRPAASVTVLILPDSLGAAGWEEVKKQLLTFYPELHAHPVQVAFGRQNGEFTSPLAVANRPRFKQLLDNVKVEDQLEAERAPAGTGLDGLLAAIPQLGPERSTVILVAELPKLDAASTAFASALLQRAFVAQGLRASLFSPAPDGPEWLALFRSLGGQVVSTLEDLSVAPPSPTESLFRVDWVVPPPSAGFVVFPSSIGSGAEPQATGVPDMALAEGAQLPSVEQYVEARKKIAEAEGLLGAGALTQARAEQVRSNLQAALQVNPREPAALELAAALYEEAKDYPAAAAMSTYLVEVRPQDGPAYALLGHELRLSAAWDRAESALQRAADLGVATVELNEDFARSRLARTDDPGALPYLQQALRLAPTRQDLWFLQGQAAVRARKAALAQDSYERGLSLGGVHIAEAGALMRLYLDTKQAERATQLAKRQLAEVPAEAGPRLELAALLDELRQSELALQAWRRLLEIEPASERGNTRVARLLLEAGDAAGAEKASGAGLNAVPNSAPLYLVKADAEEALGQHYLARRTLHNGAEAAPDTTLFARLAATEERYSGGAATAYARLAELPETAMSPSERQQALQRGFAVALRDGDLAAAGKFASLLSSPEGDEYRSLLGGTRANKSYAPVPGGLDALAFAAHAAKEQTSADRFFVEYCRTLIQKSSEGETNEYSSGLHEYFEQIATLQALGQHTSSGTAITLSFADKQSRRQTEKALSILGIKLKNSKGDVELAQGEKKRQALKQETAAALAVDEVAVEQALQSGGSYRLEIPDETAPVYPGETLWREAFYAKSSDPGGLAAALARSPRLARLYVSLNSMDRDAANELTKAVSLHDLYRDADLLFYYGSSLALEGGRAAVPGGANTEATWTSLAGASPASPGAFFRALLARDDGRLLVFFSMLAGLDRAHLTFFTATENRIRRFYGLLASSEAMAARPYASAQTSAFRRLLRSVPLEDGHVNFPGSAAVWTVAKGRSSAESQTAHLMKKLRRAAAPDEEDQVLVRLAGTQYHDKYIHVSELDNFLAVSHIDAHRSEPMDEESALLLAQRYGDYAAVYPYFSDLRMLTGDDYRQFFAALDHMAAAPPLEANLEFGELHALSEWICLLVQHRVIGDAEAAKLFHRMTGSFAAAANPASYLETTLETLRAMVSAIPAKNPAAADEVLRASLLGRHAASSDERAKDFARVLDAQQVPSLATLLAIYDAALAVPKGKASDALSAIEKELDRLPTVDLPKGTGVSGKDKAAILLYSPAGARKAAAELREQAAKRKPNPRELEKRVREWLAELQPQATLALAGPLYAYFLRSSDLVVMNDPLLLRKHHYIELGGLDSQKVPASDFNESSAAAGSYFVGGFAGFAYSAGVAAMRSKGAGGNGVQSMTAQLASLRSADWNSLDESGQRLAALRIIVAREWICEAARRAELLDALRAETLGLLPLSRRAELLNGIASRDWNRVWGAVTLSDLFALGGTYSRRFPSAPGASEAALALHAREERQERGKLDLLGPLPLHLFGCNHHHWLANAPYEEYEALPAELAERSAEFQLYLAFQADQLGMPPDQLDAVAEELAVQAFRRAQMTDYRDWQSLLRAYAAVDLKDVEKAVQP
jgi:hypothetical protein